MFNTTAYRGSTVRQWQLDTALRTSASPMSMYTLIVCIAIVCSHTSIVEHNKSYVLYSGKILRGLKFAIFTIQSSSQIFCFVKCLQLNRTKLLMNKIANISVRFILCLKHSIYCVESIQLLYMPNLPRNYYINVYCEKTNSMLQDWPIR